MRGGGEEKLKCRGYHGGGATYFFIHPALMNTVHSMLFHFFG